MLPTETNTDLPEKCIVVENYIVLFVAKIFILQVAYVQGCVCTPIIKNIKYQVVHRPVIYVVFFAERNFPLQVEFAPECVCIQKIRNINCRRMIVKQKLNSTYRGKNESKL